MQMITEWQLKQLREQYPVGARVELIYMNDPYNHKLVPGCHGTVRWVDAMCRGTVAPASASSPARTTGRKQQNNPYSK